MEFEKWKIATVQVGQGRWPHLCWPLSTTVLTSKDRDTRYLSGLRQLLHILLSQPLESFLCTGLLKILCHRCLQLPVSCL